MILLMLHCLKQISVRIVGAVVLDSGASKAVSCKTWILNAILNHLMKKKKKKKEKIAKIQNYI